MSSSFIYIDSSDRLFGSPSNFKVDIQDLNSNNEKDISLNTLSINKSFYSINNNNHSFLFSTTGTTGTTNLTNGNYNSTQFCTELNTQLNSFPLGITFASSCSSTNGKLTIASSDTSDFTITSNTQNYRYLGMNVSSVVPSVSGIWVSPNVIDLSGSRYIDVLVDLPISSVNTKNKNKNVLARVYINADRFSQILYLKENFSFCKLLTARLNQISFQLVDEFNNELDLNGTEWNCTIEIKDTPN